MLNQAFRVLTEFRFDIGHAVAGSQTLQTEVGRLSSAADNALLSFQRMSFGIAAQFGLGQGGILGLFYKAVQSSDKFYQSQLKLSNILQSNNMFTGPNAFELSMKASERALMNMQKAAREFSLPASDLVNLSAQIGAVLTVKNLDDANLTKSTDISRQFLKSAPILGVDPGLATQQLVGAISGRAELGSRLVQRLVDETGAMKAYSGNGGLKKFNALDPAKRLDVLTQSLAQFSSNAKVTHAIANSMSGQLRRLNDNLLSMFSILRPIGDALMEPIKQVLNQINSYLENEGAAVAQNLSRIIERVFRNPEGLYIFLRQISQLKRDTDRAGKALMAIGIVHGLTFALGLFGIKVGSLLGMLGAGLKMIGGFIAPLFNLTVVATLFKALGFVLRAVLAPLAALMFFFQAISRAMAIADVSNAKWLASNMPKITELLARLSRGFEMVTLPLEMAIDGIANILSWVFKLEIMGEIGVIALRGLAWALEFVGEIVVTVMAIIQGSVWALMEAVSSLMNLDFSGLGGRMSDEFWIGFRRLKDPFMLNGPEDDEKNAVSKRITNIDKIEIVNQFKEQMEPDRIAFTLVSQLEKIALNPQQAIGRSTGRNAIRN